MQAQNVLRCVPLYIQEWIIEKDINLQHIQNGWKTTYFFTTTFGVDKRKHFLKALNLYSLFSPQKEYLSIS